MTLEEVPNDRLNFFCVSAARAAVEADQTYIIAREEVPRLLTCLPSTEVDNRWVNVPLEFETERVCLYTISNLQFTSPRSDPINTHRVAGATDS